MKYFLFNNASRAAHYGIGTYMRQLLVILSANKQYQLHVVELNADNKEFTVQQDSDGITRYSIPSLESNIETEAYCRIVGCLLSPYIVAEEMAIFHFNYFMHYPLALWAKARNIHNRIILSVHYLDWCFKLNGNVNRFHEILYSGQAENTDSPILADYQYSKRFFHLCDAVVTLSDFCRQLLAEDYSIDPEKLHLIRNGLSDKCQQEELEQRKSGATETSPVILFVGRLDEIKGIRPLIKAFKKVLKNHPNAHLFLVGNGNYEEYFPECKGFWECVSFTGKIGQEELLDIYRKATLAILPSFHEQCSYSAIEYMMHGLPFVGTNSTGLSEMLNKVPEMRVDIRETDFNEETFSDELADRISLLLSKPSLLSRISGIMRKEYKKHYTLELMQQQMFEIICRVISDSSSPLSLEYLYDLDYHMIKLIHNQPDIDTEFYGMTGIGLYLWWRVHFLDKDKDEYHIYKIKEYLIYYIDWLHNHFVEDGITICAHELYGLLRAMQLEKFYPFRVNLLISMLHCPPAPISEDISSISIIANALRIANTKI